MGELISSLNKHDLTTPEALEYEAITGKTLAEYENSLGNRGKQVWIILQSMMMMYFMYWGFVKYNQVQHGPSKIKGLFVI